MLMQTYNRFNVTFIKGSGCRLYDGKGGEYIDFASGIGVNSVGYAHPAWVSAVSEQAAELAHVSNLYHAYPAEHLAARLTALSGMSNVFFSNSGAEANEGMIKLARKYSRDKYGGGRSTIVTLKQSFHGRTVTTLSATGQDVFHNHFHPFTEGFIHVPANDITALENIEDGVCAVMLEPVQGEGGVLPLDAGCLRAVSKLCAERDWLLLLDEVQTGIGRCGAWFAYQSYGIIPDAVSFAKGIAGGLPLGGFMAGPKCEDVLQPGDHATTYGGNPVCCAAALAVLDILKDALPGVNAKGERLKQALTDIFGNARGMGLMLGATVNEPPRALAERLLNSGLVCLTAGTDALRLLPPLIISDEDIDAGIEILKG